ncbi:MAG: HEAT repeat domain-containing protein [Deltaproteobacteria bacterium]
MRTVAWLILGCLPVVLAGCRKAPESCVVTGVTVEESKGPSILLAVGIDREELRKLALEAFAAAPGFEVPAQPPRKGAPRCRGTVSLLDARLVPKGALGQVEVLLRLEVEPGEEQDVIGESVRGAEGLEPGEARASGFRRAIRTSAGRAARALSAALAESRKPDAEVIRDLESSDARLRELAVGVLADRKNVAAVPGLIARLLDPNPEVADRAVGALAQMGDPRAVGPIIELSRRREGAFVAQMVRAVGDIGGPEAEAYLETMSSGHRDPVVAEAAQEALRDARRRRAGGRGAGAGP